MAADLKHMNADALKLVIDEASEDAKRLLESARTRCEVEIEQASRFLATAPASLAELIGKAVEAMVTEFTIRSPAEFFLNGTHVGNEAYIDFSKSTGRVFGHQRLAAGTYRVVLLVLPVDVPTKGK